MPKKKPETDRAEADHGAPDANGRKAKAPDRAEKPKNPARRPPRKAARKAEPLADVAAPESHHAAAPESHHAAEPELEPSASGYGRLGRMVYNVTYTVSYGVIFPLALIAHAIPKDNPIVHGILDGASAAREAVEEMWETPPAQSTDPAVEGPGHLMIARTA
jgi:hypothetical protein